LGTLGARGYELMAGLEVEFHLFKLEDPKLAPHHATQPPEPPEVSLLAHGFQYLTEARMDELEPALDAIRRDLAGLGLPLRSQEVEFGPSQCEFTFAPLTGIAAADTMVLFRSAVKQSARRNGLHATFMCRPNLPNLFSSGWHLHQCLIDKATGDNAFMTANDGEVLSETARHYVAGLLAHAAAASVFTTPTVNGYKRYRPFTLAPDRAVWGIDNKGTMIRALGAPGDPASRIENRVGEPAANPYLYMASQVVAGLDGIDLKRDPGPPSDTPYDTDAEALPSSLMDAAEALDKSALFRTAFGDTFIDYLLAIKRHEIRRFLSEVTDWEHREYFELF
ncbi:MAG: glutamine synthetase, partial [Hyphomicrobiales bacterium]